MHSLAGAGSSLSPGRGLHGTRPPSSPGLQGPRPRSSPGLQWPAETQVAPEMWFKDILRIARRIQQNSRRLRPARRAKPRRCDEEVGADGLVALVTQDIRDLELIVQYVGEGISGLISKELHHCQLALTDLLTSIHVVVTDSIILREQLLIQLLANTKVRSLAKYATHQAQILENAVAPDNSRPLDRSLRQRGTRAATTPPEVANKQGRGSSFTQGKGRRTPAPENYGRRGSSLSRESSPFSHENSARLSPGVQQTHAGRIRLSPSPSSRTLADLFQAYSGQQGNNRDTIQRKRDRMHAIVQHNMISQNMLQSGGRARSSPLNQGQAALVQALLEAPPRRALHDLPRSATTRTTATPSLLSLPATASNGGRAASLTAYSSRWASELAGPLVHVSGTHY
jgi:hypothetical protein